MPIAPAQRHHVTRILRHCPRVQLERGETIGVERLPESKLLIVVDGTVQIARARSGAKRPTIVALASAGAILLPPAANEHLGGVTAAALAAVPVAAFDLLTAVPGMAVVLCELLLDAVRERQETVDHVHGAAHADRLRETLFRLARTYGKVGPNGVEIHLPLTHELLAQITGSARETVTTALARFERDGLLVRDNGVYRLTATPSLLDEGAE